MVFTYSSTNPSIGGGEMTCMRDSIMGAANPPPLFTPDWVLQERLLSARVL